MFLFCLFPYQTSFWLRSSLPCSLVLSQGFKMFSTRKCQMLSPPEPSLFQAPRTVLATSLISSIPTSFSLPPLSFLLSPCQFFLFSLTLSLCISFSVSLSLTLLSHSPSPSVRLRGANVTVPPFLPVLYSFSSSLLCSFLP